ncbi:MAG: hypothetical protein ACQSGP_06470 [Frankia sp.]
MTVAVESIVISAEDDDTVIDAWHRALLGLAGFLPDALISEARAWLAAGRRLDLARAIAFAVTAGQISLGGEEIPLARKELTAAGQARDARQASDAVGMLDALPAGERVPAAWRFRSGAPGENGPAAALPLDLTTGDTAIALGDVEVAIVEAVRAEPNAVGLWRTWRVPAGGSSWPPPTRVFVVTAQSRSDRDNAVLASRLQAALAAAGEPTPQVEVCEVGVEPPPYQRLAQTSGALLWAREPAVEVSVARVFDEVDPVEGPRFALDRPRIDDLEDRDDLLIYLDAGVPIIDTSALMSDLLDPPRGEVVPMTFRTDGRWVWTDATSYYLDEHGIAPDPDLMRHVAEVWPQERIDQPGWSDQPLWVDEVALHRVLVHLLNPRQEEVTVWVVPQMGVALLDEEPIVPTGASGPPSMIVQGASR